MRQAMRWQQRSRLIKALIQWACATTALAAQAAAAPLARKLRASQALVEQLRAAQGKAEARQAEGRRAAEEAEEELKQAQRALATAERREAAERSRREAGEAAARARRREQLEDRGAAVRRVVRGVSAGRLGGALGTWRLHSAQLARAAAGGDVGGGGGAAAGRAGVGQRAVAWLAPAAWGEAEAGGGGGSGSGGVAAGAPLAASVASTESHARARLEAAAQRRLGRLVRCLSREARRAALWRWRLHLSLLALERPRQLWLIRALDPAQRHRPMSPFEGPKGPDRYH